MICLAFVVQITKFNHPSVALTPTFSPHESRGPKRPKTLGSLFNDQTLESQGQKQRVAQHLPVDRVALVEQVDEGLVPVDDFVVVRPRRVGQVVEPREDGHVLDLVPDDRGDELLTRDALAADSDAEQLGHLCHRIHT